MLRGLGLSTPPGSFFCLFPGVGKVNEQSCFPLTYLSGATWMIAKRWGQLLRRHDNQIHDTVVAQQREVTEASFHSWPPPPESESKQFFKTVPPMNPFAFGTVT